jgi:methanogenic corrinoid protein MtbC1
MGMSALLTTTMPYMGVVLEELDKRGLRNDFHVMVGGAPLNQEFADAIGADAYGRDAARSAEMASSHARSVKAC